MPHDVELALLTATFQARAGEAAELAAALARYVVLTRRDPACRNVDLAASPLEAGRYLVVEKWASDAARRAHLDSVELHDLADAVRHLVAGSPIIEPWEAVSAQDLEPTEPPPG